MNILEIQNCTICYQNGAPAVSDVSLSVSEGEIVSIVGESGSGKTPLIRAVLEEFEACYDRFVTDLTADFITPYEELCVSLNRQVSVIRGGREITGQSIGLSKEGELLIQTDGGIVEIGSGEVTVQGIY